MSAIDWVIWAVSIAVGGTLYTILDPVVETFLIQDTAITTISLDFLTWIWNYGILIILLVAPTAWVLMRYQKEEYRRGL